MQLHLSIFATMAVLLAGCGAPTYENEEDSDGDALSSHGAAQPNRSGEESEFGSAHFALTEEQNGHHYAVAGSFRIRDERGNLWGGFDATKNSGATHTVSDLPPGVPLELLLIGDITCYVDDVRQDHCLYMGADPNPFSVVSNTTTAVHVYVQFGQGGKVVTLCKGSAQIQLVVTFGDTSGCNCPVGDQCVTTDGTTLECRQICGGQNPGCSGNQSCWMVPETSYGVCLAP